ncbi:MAG: hypothetical protein AAB361_03940 [Patescibacteria group bacterium]
MEGEPKFKEEKQEFQRTSGIMRAAGVSREVEKEVLDASKESFDNQKKFSLESEKTPEEIEIINGILGKLQEFIKKYGGVMPPITPDHIHVCEYDTLPVEQRERIKSIRGRYDEDSQFVAVIRNSESENNLVFASRVAHELMHFCGFQSVTANPEKETWSFRVGGLVVAKKKDQKREMYFVDVDEAITEELMKRFDAECFDAIPALAKDLEDREKWIKKSVKGDKISYITTTTTKEESSMYYTTIRAQPYQYKEEREKLWQIINDICEKKPDDFKSEEEVFNVFANTYFTGNLLQTVRLIEDTYGKGFFRKLGEETKQPKE